MPRGVARRNFREDIDQNAIVWNRPWMIGMGPIGAPDAAVAKLSHQPLGEWDYVRIRRALPGDTVRAAHFHPDVFVIQQREQRSESRLLESKRGIEASHVVYHNGNGRAPEHWRQFRDQ